MIIVTGAAGFIGSNIIKALNARNEYDIIAVDDLTDGHKFKNLRDLTIRDYWDKRILLKRIQDKTLQSQVRAVIHQGACSDTTEWDGAFMMENNFEYSKKLLHFCMDEKIPFLYASSAAVYGLSAYPKEEESFENPLNVYGYSKLLFDQYVRRYMPFTESQIVGLRYFNVYGPGEDHKHHMSSVAWQHYQQIQSTQRVKLFEGSGGFDHGEQRRDFVYVDDVVNVNLWMLDNTSVNGIFNVGTGEQATFNQVGQAVIGWYGAGEIEYIPFPEKLKNCYQNETRADITSLREAGYQVPFATIEEGVQRYFEALVERKTRCTESVAA